MKKLSTEEKAKRYDEVIPQLKGLLEGIHEEKCDIMEEDIIKIFHELKESEDEKIRKWLIRYFKEVCDNVSEKEKKSVLAWLEKQGKNNMGISEATKKKLEDNLNKALEKETPESCNEFLEKQGEHNPAWSKEELDNITAAINNLEYFKNNCVYHQMGLEPAITFLKSLKERYTWKPSDEQLEAVKRASNGSRAIAGNDYLIMESLYKDLNKLREE